MPLIKKKHFYIPLTQLPPIAPNLKNIFKFHENICPKLGKNASNYKKCPQLKKHFQIPLTHLPPIIKKCPQLQKLPRIKNIFKFHICPQFFFNYHLKKKLPPFLSNLSIPNGIEKGIIWTPAHRRSLNFYFKKIL